MVQRSSKDSNVLAKTPADLKLFDARCIAEVLAGAARAALRIGTERITVELICAEAGLLTAAVA